LQEVDHLDGGQGRLEALVARLGAGAPALHFFFAGFSTWMTIKFFSGLTVNWSPDWS
jgi:hypothetical protein